MVSASGPSNKKFLDPPPTIPASEQDLNPRPPDFQVQCPNHSATLPSQNNTQSLIHCIQSTLTLRTPCYYEHSLLWTKFGSQQKRFGWKWLPLLQTLPFKDTKWSSKGVRNNEVTNCDIFWFCFRSIIYLLVLFIINVYYQLSTQLYHSWDAYFYVRR